MKSKIFEHILSIVFVSGILLLFLFLDNYGKQKEYQKEYRQVSDYINLPFADFDDPFEKALFKDVLNIFYPDQYSKNEAIFTTIEKLREKKIRQTIEQANTTQRLTWGKFGQLCGMYLKFVCIYIVTMVLTYYGIMTLGVLRFVKKKQPPRRVNGRNTAGTTGIYAVDIFLSAIKVFFKVIAYSIFFSPAYVTAYSFRTEFNTDTTFFMIVLGVVSNGLLLMYTNKFYAFLVSESRKGYVDTAIVKNLNNSYSRRTSDGITLRAILKPVKIFKGHVFDHIYKNAQYQYLSTIKEQASFCITGLIIIEMALNIHGHLNYELLQQLLYKNFDIVITIILGIFYTVKVTELFTDYLMHRNSMKYENIR
jgi:hypothetical protein